MLIVILFKENSLRGTTSDEILQSTSESLRIYEYESLVYSFDHYEYLILPKYGKRMKWRICQ